MASWIDKFSPITPEPTSLAIGPKPTNLTINRLLRTYNSGTPPAYDNNTVVELVARALLDAPNLELTCASICKHILDHCQRSHNHPILCNHLKKCLNMNRFFEKRRRVNGNYTYWNWKTKIISNKSYTYWGLNPAVIPLFQAGDFNINKALQAIA